MYGIGVIVVGAMLALGFWVLSGPDKEDSQAYEYNHAITVMSSLFVKIALGMICLGIVVMIVELLV